MNIERIAAATEVLEWLIDQANTAGEDFHERLGMAESLLPAHAYLQDYALHLKRGAEPYDALMSAVRKEAETEPLPQKTRDLLRALLPPRSA